MKDDYIRHVLEAYVLDGNFDAMFGEEWVDAARLREIIVTIPRYAFAEYNIDSLDSYIEFSEEIVTDLLKNNIISQQGDDYSDYWYRLRVPHKVKHLAPKHDANQATQRIGVLGEEALRRALLKIVEEDSLRSMEEKWAEAASLPHPQTSEVAVGEPVPASDRIVLRSDNEAAADEVATALADLSSELRSDSNEVGDAFGDDREIAVTEVDQLTHMVNQPRIRAQPVLAFAQRTLMWIAEKASAAAVADLAKRALALLFGWLSS